jgi:hypothetical protein
MRARRGEFDLVVAMTHDHGLIPVKYLGLEQGVNVTLGLPFVRTSPDHGTAFDIAGQGKADPASLVAALRMARRLAAAGPAAADTRFTRPCCDAARPARRPGRQLTPRARRGAVDQAGGLEGLEPARFAQDAPACAASAKSSSCGANRG